MKKIRCNYKNDLQQLNAWEEFKHEIKGKHGNNRVANTIKLGGFRYSQSQKYNKKK